MKSHIEIDGWLPEEAIPKVLDSARACLPAGEHLARTPARRYRVHTLYLDSNDWRIYQSMVKPDDPCIMLRIRHTDGSGRRQVAFELKHRAEGLTTCNRFELQFEALPMVLGGIEPDFEHHKPFSPKAMLYCRQFIDLVIGLGARPKLRTEFDRENYTNRQRNLRITVDHQVRWEPQGSGLQGTFEPCGQHLIDGLAMIRLKLPLCWQPYPQGYADLMELFNQLPNRELPAKSVPCAGYTLDATALLRWLA